MRDILFVFGPAWALMMIGTFIDPDRRQKFWRGIRDFADRRMHRGCLHWCGSEDHPVDDDTPTWCSFESPVNYCRLKCRRKAEKLRRLLRNQAR